MQFLIKAAVRCVLILFISFELARGQQNAMVEIGGVVTKSAPVLKLGENTLSVSFKIFKSGPNMSAAETPEDRRYTFTATIAAGAGYPGLRAGSPTEVSFSNGLCGPGWIDSIGNLQAFFYTQHTPPSDTLKVKDGPNGFPLFPPPDLCNPINYIPSIGDRPFLLTNGTWTALTPIKMVSTKVARPGEQPIAASFARTNCMSGSLAIRNLLTYLGIDYNREQHSRIRLMLNNGNLATGSWSKSKEMHFDSNGWNRPNTDLELSLPIKEYISAKQTTTPGFTITNPALLETQEPCQCNAFITVISSEYKLGKKSQVYLKENKLVLWCPGARHTWIDTSTNIRDGAIGRIESNHDRPLVFELSKGGTYTYRNGEGSVVLADGSRVELPLRPNEPKTNTIPIKNQKNKIEGIGKEAIITSAGLLQITKIQESDRFFPDCDTSFSTPDCSKAESGYKVLVLWLEVIKSDSSSIDLFHLSRDVYIVDSDGKRADCFSGGLIHGKYNIAFTPLLKSKNFILYWPNNQPIALYEQSFTEIYRFKSEYPAGSGPSSDFKVETTKKGSWQFKSMKNNAVLSMTVGLNGNIQAAYPDALGSSNMIITINPEVGYTYYAGLNFKQECTIKKIYEDGMIEVNIEGIEAIDKNDILWVSKKIKIENKSHIVLVKYNSVNSPSPIASPLANTTRSRPIGWPVFDTLQRGGNELRVRNPNDFDVLVAVRLGLKGKEFTVGASGVSSVYVPDGHFEIFFNYSNEKEAVYQGDSFSLERNGIEIQIVKVTNGNFGIRRVN